MDYTIFSWIGTVLTSSTLLPQVYKVIKTRDTKSISLIMFIIYIIAGISWIIYAAHKHDLAIIVTNSICISFGLFIFIFKLYNIKTKGEKI